MRRGAYLSDFSRTRAGIICDWDKERMGGTYLWIKPCSCHRVKPYREDIRRWSPADRLDGQSLNPTEVFKTNE